MKKFLSIITVFSLIFLLNACSNSDPLNGEWVSTSPETTKIFGEKFSFKDGNFKTNDDSIFFKSYVYNDDKKRQIKFYDEKKDSKDYDKSMPNLEGVLKIDKDKASITTEMNGTMTFERK